MVVVRGYRRRIDSPALRNLLVRLAIYASVLWE